MKRNRWKLIGCLVPLAIFLSVILVLFLQLTGFPFHYGLHCFTAIAMHNAVDDGNLPTVKKIAAKHPYMVNCTIHGIKGQPYTALGTAIKQEHWDIAAFLISHGADSNARSHFNTPLNAAVIKGNEKTIRLLVAHGAKLKPKLGRSPLETAIWHKEWKICKLLRNLGAKDIPLACEAVVQGNNTLLEREVRKDHTVLNKGYLDMQSLVHLAVEFEQIGSIRTLARLGADINYMDPQSLDGPPIGLACQNGKMAVIKTLIECGANLEWPGIETEKENGLYYAVLGSQLDVVQYLLNKGLDPNVTRTAITYFLISGDSQNDYNIAKLLISKGFIPDKAEIHKYPEQEQQSRLESYLLKYAK